MNHASQILALTGIYTFDSQISFISWESDDVNKRSYRAWKQYRTLIEVPRRIEEENYDPCIEEAHK
jgi:hypothetical protein